MSCGFVLVWILTSDQRIVRSSIKIGSLGFKWWWLLHFCILLADRIWQLCICVAKTTENHQTCLQKCKQHLFCWFITITKGSLEDYTSVLRTPQPRDLRAKNSHSKEISHSQEISQQRRLRAKKSHSKEISQQRNFTAKRSQSKEVSQQRDLTAKRSHSKVISQQRYLTAKKSHGTEVSQHTSLTAKKSHSEEISQQRSLKAKKSYGKEISQQRDLTAKKFHSKEISQQRNLTAKRSHSEEVSQQRDLTAKRSRKAISEQRDLTVKWSHSKEVSQQRDLTAKRFFTAKKCHSKEISQQRDLTAKESHSKEVSQQRQQRDLTARDLTAKRSRSKEISQQRSHTARKSGTKASFSHLQLSVFEGSLARNAFLRLMRGMLCFAAQYVPWKMDGQGLSDGCETVSGVPGSWLNRPRTVTAASGVGLPSWSASFLKEVSHESVVCPFSTFSFSRTSCTRASFLQLQLSVFEGSLARKLRFHIFNFQLLRDASHESFVFTTSTFTFWGTSHTKASFSQVEVAVHLRQGCAMSLWWLYRFWRLSFSL